MNWPFRIVTGLVALALAGGAALAMRPRPIDVDVAKVARAPLDQKVVGDGRARVRERYTVSAPVAGTLARIDFHEGDVVEPGAVLARLLPLPSPLLDPRFAAGRRAAPRLVRRYAPASRRHRRARRDRLGAGAARARPARGAGPARRVVSGAARPGDGRRPDARGRALVRPLLGEGRRP